MSDMTLNITQQVLRTVTVAVATAAKADLRVLSCVLAESTHNAALHPQAKAMLEDLAAGIGQLANAFENNGAPLSPR